MQLLYTFLCEIKILCFFTNIVLIMIDTLFICFLMDREKGVMTKPELHDVIGDVLHYKKVKWATPNTSQGAVVRQSTKDTNVLSHRQFVQPLNSPSNMEFISPEQ